MKGTARPIVLRFTGGDFGENGYVVVCPHTRKGILVDPGASVGAMLDAVEREEVDVTAIVLTHAHIDHVDGVARAKRDTAASIHLHPADQLLYREVPLQARLYGVTLEVPPPVDEYLQHGEVIRFGEVELEVRHTPGHSPGHVVLIGQGVGLVGDCVFAGSIGRTDLPGGDFSTLMASIRREILPLPDETVLYSGHGPETTVGHEKRSNPFLVPTYGGSSFA